MAAPDTDGVVILVEDDPDLRLLTTRWLEKAGWDVEPVESGEALFDVLPTTIPDCVCLDLGLPGMSGMETLHRLRRTHPRLPVVILTADREVDTVVEAMQGGAYDYLPKPLDRTRLETVVRNAVERHGMALKIAGLEQASTTTDEYAGMLGRSPVMRALFRQVDRVASSEVTVLLRGESGAGKELVARAIHDQGPRARGPFVALNCAAVAETLQEAELFGHEKGAFTGADRRRAGRFEQADGGTLFLDEIGDMSGNAQAKVLRALQSGEISRVGSEKAIAVDVRVLAATNKDLELEVKEGRFREDLYFRLNVVPLKTPPLRDRPQDVPLLVKAFLRDFARENGLREKPIEAEVLEALAQRSWPGNVRELKNVVERMAILSGETIGMHDLPDEGRLGQAVAQEAATPAPGLPSTVLPEGERMTLREYREHAEKQYILAMLDETGWNISRAAVKLGVERTNLHKKMRTYGIKRETHQNR